MDILERAEAERAQREEALQAAHTKHEERRPHTDMPLSDYPVTIIGCIRGFDGWYQAGYDHRKQTIIPLAGASGCTNTVRTLRGRTKKHKTKEKQV